MDRPQWLINVTNDSWFGHTTGPHQHFASAILRAVEEGVPVIRVATTGISGVIDSYGHVRTSLPFGTTGIIDTRLPSAQPQVTLYARMGDRLVFGLGVFFSVFVHDSPSARSSVLIVGT